MAELALGDRVQVALPDGRMAYEPVYFMTHQDADSAGSYLKVDLSNGLTLVLSPRHFLPTSSSNAKPWGEQILVGANDLRSGDTIWYHGDDGTIARSTVSEVSRVTAIGAFNPMTASGTIVVDGIVASAHSDWFLDGIAPPGVQAAVYDAMFSPVRGFYQIAGPEAVHMVTMEWGVVDWIRRSTSTPSRAIATLMLFVFLASMPLVGFVAWRRRGRKSMEAPPSEVVLGNPGAWNALETPGHIVRET